VFLLQAHGRRRWRIGAQKDLTLVEGLPLKILELRTGRGVRARAGRHAVPAAALRARRRGRGRVHDVFDRLPRARYQELGEAFLQFMADSIDLPGRYADPDLQPAKNPAEIPRDMLPHRRRTEQGALHEEDVDDLHRRAPVRAEAQRVFHADPHDVPVLARLADERALPGELVLQASPDVLDALYMWYADGWLEL
jgi:50S ribosomal protein L16 3-hydroxylase